jgi:hypothetical protein
MIYRPQASLAYRRRARGEAEDGGLCPGARHLRLLAPYPIGSFTSAPEFLRLFLDKCPDRGKSMFLKCWT